MSTYPFPEEYLPPSIYKQLFHACRDQENVLFFSTETCTFLKTSTSPGCHWSAFTYKEKTYNVETRWGTDQTGVINSLFLLIYSQDDLYVQVYRSQKENAAGKEYPLLNYPFEGVQFNFNKMTFLSKKCPVSFPAEQWNTLVEQAFNQSLLPGIRCDLHLSGSRVFGEPVPNRSNTSGLLSCTLKALLALGVLFVAYKVFRAYQAKTSSM
ncbi:MAG: hypothetical protein AB7N99_02255 [Simkaniaceae bacterium]